MEDVYIINQMDDPENIISTNNNMVKKLEYYLKEPNNDKEFKKRAREIGFTGTPLRKDKPTKTFIKFLNNKFKEEAEYKNTPIVNGKITQPFKTHQNQGGIYLKRFQKLVKDGESFTINMENKEELTKILQNMLGVEGKILMTYTLDSGDERTYTLTERNAEAVMEGVVLDNEEYEQESDQEFKTFLRVQNIRNVKFDRIISKKKSGAFFKFTHNIEGLDLTDLQIFNDVSQITNDMPCCFIQALICADVEKRKIETIKHMIKTRDIPMCKINEICEKVGLHIKVKNIKFDTQQENKCDVVEYPTNKNSPYRQLDTIHIGRIHEHYFYIREVPITSFCVNNYEEVKKVKDHFRINKRDGKYYNRENKFIDSFKLVRLLMENRDVLLKPISLCNEIYKTQYYNEFNKIETLEYDEDVNTKLIEYEDKEDKDNFINVFADFETITNTETHIPFMLCCKTDNGFKKFYYGLDCCEKMLKTLNYTFPNTNFRFIFHNAGYDLRFMLPYLSNHKIIERGKFLLRYYGWYFPKPYKKGQSVKIEIQDSYALIPEPLRKFKDMFKIDVKKEILPYCLYTAENVNVRNGLIPMEECIKYVEKQFHNNNIGKKICPIEMKKFVNEFKQNVKKWNCNLDLIEKGKVVNMIKYALEYCRMDVNVLQEGYNKFKGYINDICGLNLDNYISLASVANDFMMKEGVYDDMYMISGNVREFISKCMAGGRTMTRRNEKCVNKVNQLIADFDAVSLYPSAMERLGGYLKGRPKILTTTNYDTIKNYDGYFIEIVINKVGKKYPFPLMSRVLDDGIREWTNEMEGETFYADKTTLEDLIKFQKIEFNIVRGYYFDEGRNYKLKDVIRHLFNTRLKEKQKKNPIEKVYKLLMNSAYGKTLLKPFETEDKYVKMKEHLDWVSNNYNWIKDGELLPCKAYWKYNIYKEIDNHFNIAHAGIEVLSTSKRIMNEMVCLVSDLEIDMYYTDTDSTHIDNSKLSLLEEEYRKLYGKELLGNNMGQFNSDFDSDILDGEVLAKNSIFLGKKCYIDELVGTESGENVDYHIRLKGVPNQAILHYCEKNNLTPYQLYQKLYMCEKIEFDMCCSNKKVMFKFHNNNTITSIYSGELNSSRSVQF
jgi:hypothetical protein